METKHTKGKWRQFAPNIDGVRENIYRRVVAGNGCFNKDAPNDGFALTGYISESNTKLIAAAPDLLEALIGALNDLKTETYNGVELIPSWKSKAINAINKATK